MGDSQKRHPLSPKIFHSLTKWSFQDNASKIISWNLSLEVKLFFLFVSSALKQFQVFLTPNDKIQLKLQRIRNQDESQQPAARLKLELNVLFILSWQQSSKKTIDDVKTIAN